MGSQTENDDRPEDLISVRESLLSSYKIFYFKEKNSWVNHLSYSSKMDSNSFSKRLPAHFTAVPMLSLR